MATKKEEEIRRIQRHLSRLGLDVTVVDADKRRDETRRDETRPDETTPTPTPKELGARPKNPHPHPDQNKDDHKDMGQ